MGHHLRPLTIPLAGLIGRRALPWTVSGSLLILFLSCVDDGLIGPGDVQSVRVTPDSIDLEVGTTVAFRAAALDGSLALLTGESVSWSSDDVNVAVVNDTGLVEAVGAGRATITAVVDGVRGDGIVKAAFSPGAGTSQVTSAPGTISAGSQQSAITVRVLDQLNNPVVRAAVTLAATGTGNSIVQPATTTDANGDATGTLSSTVVETKTVTATVNGNLVLTNTATVDVVLGTADADQSSIDATPATISASTGVSQSTIMVTARDGAGNTLAGVGVTLVATGINNTFGSTAGTTDANGVFTTTFSSTTAEVKTITATIGGAAVTDQATVTVDTDNAAGLVAVAFPADSARAGTALAAPPAVRVVDQFGGPVPNIPVTFAVTSGGGAITGSMQTTDASGIATPGSWTLDTISGGLSADGTFANTVSATASVGSVTFTARAYFTLGDDVQAIWTASFACIVCHTGSPATGTPLNISTAANSFASMVSVAASCDAAEVRIVPGDPGSSALMVRLDGGVIGACPTDPMPPGGVLSTEQREIVRAWILHGAFNN